MALFFANNYHADIWIAFLYNDAGCRPTPFRKTGWWHVRPGELFNAWDTDLRNVGRFAAFYAEEFKDSGGATWSGTGNGFYRIPDVGFNQCYDDNTNCNQQPNFVQLDFRKDDDGTHPFIDLKVTLGPAPGQIRMKGSVPID